ncbi:MAG: hypothetical protein WAV38_39545, partial [Xanthobacteraceae bacterium]
RSGGGEREQHESYLLMASSAKVPASRSAFFSAAGTQPARPAVAAVNGVPNLDACRLHAQRQTALMRVPDAPLSPSL